MCQPEIMNHLAVCSRLRLLTLSILAVFFTFFALSVVTEAAEPSDELQTSDRLIIKLRGERELDQNTLRSFSELIGKNLTIVRPMSGGAYVLKLPEPRSLTELESIARMLMTQSMVQYCEPDRKIKLEAMPNDPKYSLQWNYFESTGGVNLPPAWDMRLGAGTPDMVVGVIDTGVVPHQDLDARLVPGYDFRDGDDDPTDPGTFGTCNGTFQPSSWHGIATAGLIGAITNNRLGMAGVTWFPRILPLRALGECDFGNNADIIDALRWGAGLPLIGPGGRLLLPSSNNAGRVLNMSLSGPGSCSQAYQSAIDDVTAVNAVVVVTAGNTNTNIDAEPRFPATCGKVITVTGTNRAGDRSLFFNDDGSSGGGSNFGSRVNISGPGGQIRNSTGALINEGHNGVLTLYNLGEREAVASPEGDAYAFREGTSFAAPHVSGIAAAMLSVNPFLRPNEVLKIIQNTARPFPEGSTCTTSTCGAGIIDAGAAVEQARDADLASTAGIRLLNDLVDFDIISNGTISPPCAVGECFNPPGTVAQYGFVARLKIKSDVSRVRILDPQIEVSRLTNGNLVCAPVLQFEGSPAAIPYGDGLRKHIFAITTDGRLAQIRDTENVTWQIDFPAEEAKSNVRFQGSPAAIPYGDGRRKHVFAITTDGRLAQIRDTENVTWQIDFPAEAAKSMAAGVGRIFPLSEKFLLAGTSIDVNFNICLRDLNRFQFTVNVGGHDQPFIK